MMESILEFESMSENIRIFNQGLHSFFEKLHNQETIKSFYVTYSSSNDILITVIFQDDYVFEEQFTYNGDLYNGSSKQPERIKED